MTPLFHILKRETRDAHEALERTIGIERWLETPASYTRLLSRFYGLYAGLEPQLEDQARHLLDDWPERRKLPRLARDLAALGVSAAQLGRLPRPAPLEVATPAQAAGCLYVLEGSTLGGRLIARQLEHLGMQGQADAFFGSYGPEVGVMWKRLAAQLGAAQLEPEAACDAASATFGHFAAWFAAAPQPERVAVAP